MNMISGNLLFDASALRERVTEVLSRHCSVEDIFPGNEGRLDERESSVLVLLGEDLPEDGGVPEVCVILNKRSKEVKQPGDLCCPGGAVEKIDHFLARLLSFRGSILWKWPCWSELKRTRPEDAEFLSLLYAAGLREAWEEMGLNPFRVDFLGPLPTHYLVMYRRSIHPMVAWISRQGQFRLSWEVERIVKFPLHALLNPFNYAHYRMFIPPHLEWRFRRAESVDFPCFIYKTGGRADLLWGVTFRIVTRLLEMIFGFKVPNIEKLPLVPAYVDDRYVR